jgi:CRISPR-associated exonuclease Cas4
VILLIDIVKINDIEVTGTMIWYYHICKREVWLISRQLTAEQDNDNIVIGRFLHENSYNRASKEIIFDNMRFDIVKKQDDQIIIGEIKKSSHFFEASKMQLLYYLYRLKEYGIEAKGELLYPKEKKKEVIKLSNEDIDKMRKIIINIKDIITNEKPTKVVKCKYCSKCAYNDFCWS